MPLFKGEIEIGKFCETARKTDTPVQEESVTLVFPVLKMQDVAEGFKNPSELLGMTPAGISALIGDHDKAGIKVNEITGEKAGVYNIIINDYEFIGNTFSSFVAKRVKKQGTIIIRLRVKIKYQGKFHEQYPRFIKDVLDIEITEVNEQMKIPGGPDQEETPAQDSQPKKTGSRYSLGRICDDESCEEPITDKSKYRLCKEHR